MLTYEVLVNLALMFVIPGVILDIYYSNRLRRAVRGSYQRYVAATVVIVANGAQAIGFSAYTIAGAMRGSPFMIIFGILVVVMCVFTVIHTLRSEDNWFNDRWNKLKQVIKKAYKAATSVRINVPRPITA